VFFVGNADGISVSEGWKGPTPEEIPRALGLSRREKEEKIVV